MDILVVGLNHKTSPVELRERLAFTPEEAREAYEKFLDYHLVREVMILSTCNRVEIYSWAGGRT